ncbi:hypothetical protein [Microbacterium sp. A93]|uniref:hypothetical protein n=1 Tax=unclassified Microbacterium TaxID=2609290 RepID=UPI003F4305C2
MTEEGRLPLGLDPGDLGGHTIEELTDYLDAGRTPADPSIDDSSGCALALEALARLRALTPELMARDAAAEPEPEPGWIQSILSGIMLDARSGRRIPLADADEASDLAITEGAVRGLIRAAENVFPGILIGRCRLNGDVTERDAPIGVEVDVSVPFGEPIVQLADRLRSEIFARLRAHTRLAVTGIDITVHDISTWTEGDR